MHVGMAMRGHYNVPLLGLIDSEQNRLDIILSVFGQGLSEKLYTYSVAETILCIQSKFWSRAFLKSFRHQTVAYTSLFIIRVP